MTRVQSDHPTILSGLLLPDDHSLPMLLDYLHQCERSGALLIHTVYGSAHLYFRTGQLQHVQYQQHSGVLALAVLMQVRDQAAFTFQLNRESPESTVSTSLGHLLMSAAQMLDEGRAPVLETTPDAAAPAPSAVAHTPAAPDLAPPPSEPDIRYDLVPALTVGAEHLTPLSAEHRRMLGAINARRSVAELARLTGLTLDGVTTLLRPHLSRGELTLGPPLLHPKFWIELLRLTNTVAGKDSDVIIKEALVRIGAVPGAIPISLGRTLVQSIEQALGAAGTPRRLAFSRGSYQLRMMILNATNTTEEDWNQGA